MRASFVSGLELQFQVACSCPFLPHAILPNFGLFPLKPQGSELYLGCILVRSVTGQLARHLASTMYGKLIIVSLLSAAFPRLSLPPLPAPVPTLAPVPPPL
jgi:hypothetical protein